ncbi:MAG: hypothetical protein K2V38_27515, partial [Gemmataceae bacterium]|nr:hypothetical protein [Gemmataceae bacterium]
PLGQRLYDDFRRNQLPALFRRDQPAAGELRLLARLESIQAQDRLIGAVTGALTTFLETPTPRERVQRGQFQDAAREVVRKQEEFVTGRQRLNLNAADRDQQIAEWIGAANTLYGQLSVAVLDKNKEAEATLLGQSENLWKQPGARYLADLLSAEVGLGEATFLLALCKHEEAERSQTRLERAAPPEAERLRQEAAVAWKTAADAWRNYLQRPGAGTGFPNRPEQARGLAARAETLAAASAPPKK